MKGGKIKIKNMSFFVLFFLLFNILAVLPVMAAGSLYLTPNTKTVVINRTFNVGVKINTGGDPVNAAEGTITFDSGLLSVTGISKGGSIFNLWTVDPKANGNSISFGGGIPHPGYTGSAGTIFTITFKAKKTGTAQISFSSGAVLANDGKGTNILASMGSGSFTISPKVEAPKSSGNTGETSKPKKDEPKVPARLIPNIVSLTHPDDSVWYSRRDVELKWDMPDGVTDISYAFDNDSGTIPGNASDGTDSSKEYKDTKDGVWYFHLKLKDKKGWGTPGHFRLQIDNSPPNPFDVLVERPDENDWPWLKFEAKDDYSGVDKYEVKIGSLDEKAYEVDGKEAKLQVRDLEIGKHTASVKAIDKAGNAYMVEEDFFITALVAPSIESYPDEMKPSDKLYMSGTAMPNSSIKISLNKENSKYTVDTKSDSEGKWFVISDQKLSEGRVVAEAISVNKNGLMSEKSNQVSFMVSPPIFTKFGNFVVSYFTVFVSLIFIILVIILLIVLIIYFIAKTKKQLRREAVEVEEVLKKNLEELKKNVYEDIEKVKSSRTATERKKQAEVLETELNIKIDTAQEKIMKEIKDVEDLLK